jgi:hypothetical protein
VSPSDIQENKEEILGNFRALRDDIDTWLTEIFPECPDIRRVGRELKNDRPS